MRLIDYWIDDLQELREFQTIANALQPEITAFLEAVEGLANEFYINKMTLYGVRRTEKNLSIAPPASATLDERKFRIKARKNKRLPYTDISLLRQLVTLCGEGNVTLLIDPLAFTVTVRVALTARNNVSEIESILGQQVPLNMVIDIDLMYNQHSTLARHTHAQLSAYTHYQLREQGGI